MIAELKSRHDWDVVSLANLRATSMTAKALMAEADKLGLIDPAKTAAIGREAEELKWDLNYLLKLWEAIDSASKPQHEDIKDDQGNVTGKGKRLNPAPYLIYLESNLVVRAIRDYFHDEIGEILIDTPDIHEQAQHFMALVMPNKVNIVKHYRDDTPLFSRFQIEHQIESAHARSVNLPSGGAIVITCAQAGVLESLWTSVRKDHPRTVLFLSRSGRAGMILAHTRWN